MKTIKRILFGAALILGVATTTKAVNVYHGTSCLGLASGPAIGSCVTSTYGYDCDHSTTAGSQCAGYRDVYDYVGL